MKNTILITGATGAIGAALAETLYKKNISPIITYNKNKHKANQLSNKYSSPCFNLDLQDESTIIKLVNDIVEEKNNLLGVILCASPNLIIEPFTKINANQIKNQLEINVIGNHKLLSYLIKKIFKKNKKGIVIGILSEAMGQPLNASVKSIAPYIVSKYGLLGLLSSMKAEYQWIDVETISPGFTESDMLNSFDHRFLDKLREDRKINNPEDVANDIFLMIDNILRTR